MLLKNKSDSRNRKIIQYYYSLLLDQTFPLAGTITVFTNRQGNFLVRIFTATLKHIVIITTRTILEYRLNSSLFYQ